MAVRAAMVVVLVLSGGCTRLGFGRAVPPGSEDGPVTVDGAGPEDMAQPMDRGPLVDAAAHEGTVAGDATPSQLQPLDCDTPSLVSASTLPHLSEAALRTNGLVLLARTMAVEGYASVRTGVVQPFGPWQPSTLLAGRQDPTFFKMNAVEHAVVAYKLASDGGRHLELCAIPGGSCQKLSIKDGAGQIITEDVDGPSVAAVPGGKLLMAFNRNTDAGESSIYLAESTAADPIQWKAVELTVLDQTGVKEDDPALSPDGLTLVFNKPTPGQNGDLYVSERSSLNDPFPAARVLTGVNSSSSEGSAYLAHWSSASTTPTYELFFSSERGGTYAIYRALCQR